MALISTISDSIFTRKLTMSLLLDRKLKNKEKKTSRTGWTFLTIQRFVISLDYLGCSWVEVEEKLQIGFLLLFAII